MKFDTVYIENAVKDARETRNILRTVRFSRKVFMPSYKRLLPFINFKKSIGEQKKDIILARNTGTFIKRCIRDKENIRENEYFLYLCSGCLMDCQYCYLQDYLDAHALIFFVNKNAFYRQLEEFLTENKSVYLHAGEVCDPFVMERISPYLDRLVSIFSHFRGSLLEIRSKTVPPEHFFALKGRRNIIISETLSPEPDILQYERGTSSLDSRLSVLERCRKRGFSVAIRLDPVIYSENFKAAYGSLLRKVFSRIPAEEIFSISLGALRLTNDLGRIIRFRFPSSRLLTGEFLQSPAGKIKYFLPYREMLYRYIIPLIKKYIPSGTLPRLSLSMDRNFEKLLD